MHHALKVLFYHPATIGARISGSGIRPSKILKALRELGHDVEVLDGTDNDRRHKIKILKSQIDAGRHFDFVYFENTTVPFMQRALKISSRFWIPRFRLDDIFFLLFLRKRRIPIGYFFRDIHWLFPEVYGPRRNSLKIFLMAIFGRLELFLVSKMATKIFCPSAAFAEYLKSRFGITAFPIPPGSDLPPNSDVPLSSSHHDVIRLLFVGGTGELYNPKLFLSALKKFKSDKILLRICTRKMEWDEFMKGFELPQNVEILHLGPDDLPSLYKETDICVNYSPPSAYQTLCWSLKTSEYLTSGAPVLMFKGVGVAELIQERNYGWVIEYSENGVLSWLNHITQSPSEIEKKSSVVRLNRHLFTWRASAERIVNLLHEV